MNSVADTSPVIDPHRSTEPGVSGPISAPMVAALEGAWAAIRWRHPEVPAVVLVLGAGSIGTSGGLRLGHFAAMRWTDPDEATEARDDKEVDGVCVEGDEQAARDVRLPEVFIGGEGLVRGPADVLGTLLHEAAHALAHVRGIKDTSRQGRWHNAKFKALAKLLGFEAPALAPAGALMMKRSTRQRSDYGDGRAGLEAVELDASGDGDDAGLVRLSGGKVKLTQIESFRPVLR